jgi:hypothetical protein
MELLGGKVAEQFNPKPEVHFFKNFGTAEIKVHLPADKEIENRHRIRSNNTPVPFPCRRPRSFQGQG